MDEYRVFVVDNTEWRLTMEQCLYVESRFGSNAHALKRELDVPIVVIVTIWNRFRERNNIPAILI